METRLKLLQRHRALINERQSFISHWRDLAEFVKPRKGRFLVDDVNKGDKRHQSIINSTGTRAHRVATAGLMTGVMSPSRPWFNLGTQDPDLKKFEPVKIWLASVEEKVRKIFNESNLYNMAPVMLGDLLLFATGAMTQVDDYEDVARFYTHPVGSYAIAQDETYRVRTFTREFTMSCTQMVDDYGLANVSSAVKLAYEKQHYYTRFPVIQMIFKNPDAGKSGGGGKKYISVHFEPGSNSGDGTYSSGNAGYYVGEKFLRISGFHEFPTYVPRWDVTGEDDYGTDCPGMTTLGDVKGLQLMEKRKAQAIDKQVNPPLKGPGSLKNTTVSGLPGGLTLYDAEGKDALSPIYTVAPNVQQLRVDLEAQEARIKEGYFNELFRAISDMEGIQPKNQLELNERKEESLQQLGPVLERVHGEFLSPMIDRTFAQGVRAGIFPPPPAEIQGQTLQITYISSLAMAQRSVATRGIDRLVGFVTGLATAGVPGAIDNLDGDQAISEYSDLIGAPPKLIRPQEDVMKLRADRQKEQQATQAMGMANAGADTVQKLSASPTAEPNALTDLAAGLQSAQPSLRRGR